MEAFRHYTGLCVPFDRSNVDTDMIIPKQYLKSVKRSGFGTNLFDSLRYLDPGEPGQDHSKRQINYDFILNQLRYAGSSILMSRENFGCGSSREHAVWALLDYGFRAVIAPSFADIFYSNAVKNGLMLVVLPVEIVDKLFVHCYSESESYRLTIDLVEQFVSDKAGNKYSFEFSEFDKQCLLEGSDEIDLTLRHAAAIREYENRRRREAPWLFDD